jgi:uncharacterized membrane protein YsdA (DUF1294 family)
MNAHPGPDLNPRHPRLRLWHLVALLALLIPSGLAVRRLTAVIDYRWLLGYAVVISMVTYGVYAADKDSAADKFSRWRAPELLLHAFELGGGWPGAFLAQRQLRHKCSKASYQIVYWLIVAAHVGVASDYLLGWRMARRLIGLVHPGAGGTTP